jgi:DNA-binding PadR family transcriptional regulator
MRGPAHGYQLKLDYERLTRNGPINIGQVYKALDLLQRDGLVEREDEDPGDRRITYHVTDDGRRSAQELLLEPSDPPRAGRSAVATKVLLATQIPGVDPVSVLDAQRAALVASVQNTRRLARGRALDTAERLGIEAELAVTEAELRWLDLCEDELRGGG